MPTAVVEEASATQLGDAEYWTRVYALHPASITIARTSEADFKARQLVVWIDGARVGDLMFGDAISRDVDPGPHSIRVSNTLVWKTLTFDVKPGEQVRVEAINRPGRLTYPMLVMLGVGALYVTLRRVS